VNCDIIEITAFCKFDKIINRQRRVLQR
jgi:hypothetical protein